MEENPPQWRWWDEREWEDRRQYKIVRIVWLIDRIAVEKFLDLRRMHRETKDDWVSMYGTGTGWEWYTYNKIIIPVTYGTVVVRIYGHLTPAKGLINQWGCSMEWIYNSYQTEIDPLVADQMIHFKYFDCWTSRCIRRAMLGEKILHECRNQVAHKGLVLSLQFLCLRVLHGQQERASRTATRRRGATERAICTMAGRYHGRNQGRSGKAFPSSNSCPSLAILCGLYRVRKGRVYESNHFAQ
ncbi:viral infectivity factor [Simian immunodeficiency virus]|uniref:Virion infectivity factor n=1 Tax=Simian immunodeficiency virus TaxID=11723 RepID=Q9WPP4_SIV|nr:viral infectivity factor [Simian immunodeficiency virus]